MQYFFKLTPNKTIFLLVLLSTFAQVWYVRFSTFDDMFIDVAWELDGLQTGLTSAKSQARFQHLYMWPISAAPHLLDNPLWLNGFRILGFGLVLISLYWAVMRVFIDPALGKFSSLLVLLFFQNGWDHNLVTSYPLIFNLYIASFFASIAVFDVSIERRSIGLACVSALLLFVSLSSEIFILLSPVYVWVLLSGARRFGFSRSLLIKVFLRNLIPLYATIVGYLVVYGVWRFRMGGSSYDGTSINGDSFKSALTVTWHYSINGFPIQSLTELRSSIHYLWNHSEIYFLVALFQSCLMAVLAIRLMRQQGGWVPRIRLLQAVFVTGLAMFLVNSLIAVTAKYQAWVESGSRSYVYSQYSAYFAAILVALLVVKIGYQRTSPDSSTLVQKFMLGVVAALVFVVSLSVTSRNSVFAEDQKVSSRKWQLVDKWLDSEPFKTISNGSSVVAPALINDYRGIAQSPAWYWTLYVRAKSGKELEFRSDPCLKATGCYFLSFLEEPNRNLYHLLFGSVTSVTPLIAEEVWTLSLPSSQDVIFAGLEEPVTSSIEMVVGGGDRSKVSIVSRLFDRMGSQDFTRVTTDAPLLVDSLVVSDMTTAIRLEDGFFLSEGPVKASWNWATSPASLTVASAQEDGIYLSGRARSIHPSDFLTFKLGALKLKRISISSDYWTDFLVWVPCDNSICSLQIKAERESIRASQKDSRIVSFQLQQMNLRLGSTP